MRDLVLLLLAIGFLLVGYPLILWGWQRSRRALYYRRRRQDFARDARFRARMARADSQRVHLNALTGYRRAR